MFDYKYFLLQESGDIDLTGEAMFEEETAKPEAYKENYIFRDKLMLPYVSEKLKQEATRDKIVELVSTFMGDHSTALAAPGPIYSFVFGTNEIEQIYDIFGMSNDIVLSIYSQVVEDTYFGKISKNINGSINSTPYKLFLYAILADGIQNNYDDVVESCKYILGFIEYPIMYRKYWKVTVREDVMEYTIEHLGAKFKATKCKTLLELIYYDINKAVEYRRELFKTAPDNAYIDIMRDIHNRYNSTLQNIAHEYFENIKNNKGIVNTKDTYDDGNIAEQDGHNTRMAQDIDKSIGKLSNIEINSAMAKLCAENSSVDHGTLLGFISQIYAYKGNRIADYIENVIMSFYDKYPNNNGIGSSEFLNYGLGMYKSISASKNEYYKTLRSILDLWMYTIIDIKSIYRREQTWIQYTRAIHNYFIVMIKYYNN